LSQRILPVAAMVTVAVTVTAMVTVAGNHSLFRKSMLQLER
jgi:hypothetical protein